MTPIELARSLVRDDDRRVIATGVAMIARALSDGDPETLRMGWPVRESIDSAARYLGVEPMMTSDFAALVEATMPTISDAMLNRAAR